MRLNGLIIIALLSAGPLFGRMVDKERITQSDQTYLDGFRNRIAGQELQYQTPIPILSSALLVRATDGRMFIEWETEPVRLSEKQSGANFLWYVGLGCNLGNVKFDLYINDRFALSFRSADLETWKSNGEWGTALEFNSLVIDRYGDRIGFMRLFIPWGELTVDQPVRLKVIGERANSNAWYMTFEERLSENITIVSPNALVKDGAKRYHPVIIHILNLYQTDEVTIQADGLATFSVPLQLGHNRIPLNFDQVNSEKKITIRLTIDQTVVDRTVVLEPVRPWMVYLVQHTHTDIGYTRPQTEILSEHLRFIDYALDYCDQTDTYPDDARFRWTCEASWPVREYMKNRPMSQIERLKRRIAEGRIELTAMMFNMSEIADEAAYVDFIRPVERFRAMDLPVVTAMQNDVNGAAFCLVDYFKDSGVQYLIMGQNATRALKPFKLPTAFWWESPAGNRLLTFRAEHYMTANFWGVHTGKIETVENELFDYLKNLRDQEYPYDRIAVQYSGYTTDNSPPSTVSSDVIKEWNEKYEWPKLRNATAREFMDYIRENHRDELSAYRGAWPDWWTDGFGSSVRETAAARRTHADMIANSGLLSMARLMGARLPDDIFGRIDAVQDALLFYDEHTFGAAESISDPMAENSQIQWAEKASYVWEAVKSAGLIREIALGLVQPYLPKSDVPTIAVFNTLNDKRSGLFQVYIDHQILPNDRVFHIYDDSGGEMPAQLLSSRSDGSYWALWAEDVPAFGFKVYRVVVEAQIREPHVSVDSDILENSFYRIQLNREKGTIRRLYDQKLAQEWIDPSAEWELGQIIHEALGNRYQLERFRLDNYNRTTLSNIVFHPGNDGDIWQSISFTGQLTGCAPENGVNVELRLFKHVRRIELYYTIRKLSVNDPEGIYVAFPFHAPDWTIVYEAQGGNIVPGVDQLPGSSSDWHTVQNFACIRGSVGQIVLSSDAIPLMQLGDINTGKFQYIAKAEHPHLYSWVLNNYWPTNFKASQEGELKWSYSLTSSSDTSNAPATRFGWENRVPLIARVIPAGTSAAVLPSTSMLSFTCENILMINARPVDDGKSIILHLREIEGNMAVLDLSSWFKSKTTKISEVNVFGEPIHPIKSLTFKPFEVRFVKYER